LAQAILAEGLICAPAQGGTPDPLWSEF